MDLKLPGYEAAVVDALTERALDERALISSTHPESLRVLGELAPHIRRGWSVPNVRRDYTKNYALMLPAYLVRALVALGPAAPGGARAAGRRVRGADGQSPPGQPATGARGARGRSASCTCGPWTTRTRSGDSRRWGSTR